MLHSEGLKRVGIMNNSAEYVGPAFAYEKVDTLICSKYLDNKIIFMKIM
ncbi:hypothetical protein [Bacillus paramycoides]|nr:hypothetical protein [Bacillus paramycoides]